jgi:methylglutaconyl-CoA hydratase
VQEALPIFDLKPYEMDTLEYIRYEREGRLATLTLNRPEKRNALNYAFVREIKDALTAADQDPQMKALLIRAEGPAFCAGMDLHYMQNLQGFGLNENIYDISHTADMLVQLYKLRKPVIAVVEGPALATGCALLTACDFVIASDDATFGFPEVRRGFVPGIPLIFLLRRVNEANARALLLTGEAITAAEAQTMGLIFKAYPKAELDIKLGHLLDNVLNDAAPGALELTKRLMGDLQNMPIQEALTFAAKMSAHVRDTFEARKAVAAFLTKQELGGWE